MSFDYDPSIYAKEVDRAREVVLEGELCGCGEAGEQCCGRGERGEGFRDHAPIISERSVLRAKTRSSQAFAFSGRLRSR